MRLHYHPASTFAQRVRIAIDEKGIDVELVLVDIPARAHRAASYLAKNPYGRVPTLEDDDFVLYESSAILEYLEAVHPTPPLLPADRRLRARAAMHMKLCDLEFGVHTRALIFPTRFVAPDRWDEPAMQSARDAISKHLRIVDAELASGTFLVGDSFTLADVAYAPFVRFLDELRVEASPRVRAWAERVLARPSVRRTWLDR